MSLDEQQRKTLARTIRKSLSRGDAVEETVDVLLAGYEVNPLPQLPTCKFCGADCSEGRNWNGGDDYECPRCAEGKLQLRHIVGAINLGTDQKVTALLESGWRQAKGTEAVLADDIQRAPSDIAAHLWAQGWRR